MSTRICTNYKDSLGNDLGCRFLPKEDAIDFISNLNEFSNSQRTLWGSGCNDNYELGLGADTTNRSSPVVLGAGSPNMRNLIRVAGGQNFTTALDSAGNIWAWGQNTYGQLGDLSTVTKSTPVVVAGTGGFKNMAGGRDFVLAVKHAGTLWSWGRAYSGVLGDGAALNKSTPVQVGALTCWKSVWASPAGYQAAGITVDGKLFRWGTNGNGEIGDGTTVVRSSPVQVGAGTDWRMVNNSFAIKTNGTLWAWGNNGAGRLGDGTTVSKSSPVQVGAGTDWKTVAAMAAIAAIKTDGTLWTWGCSTDGRLGDGTTTCRSSPVQVGTATNWKSVVSTRSTFLAQKTDGSIWGWGVNSFGELGDGTTVAKTTPIQLTGANQDVFHISQSDTIFAWLREPKILASDRATGLQANTVDFDDLFIRRDMFICSGAMTWGLGTSGQLGDNSTTSKSSPVQLAKTGSIWREINAGYCFMNGIQHDGTLWAWGAGGSGKLGDGTTVTKSTPIQIGLLSWRQATAGVFAAAAIRCDGTLWTWGKNNYGQLGDGTTVSKSSPVQVGASGDWLCVQYTFCTMAALKINGTLWTWGANVQGQLGDNSTVSKSSPVQVGTGTDWINFSVGSNQVMAQKSDYTLWGWGHDQCGELMTAAIATCYSTPVQANSGSVLWRHFSVRAEGSFFGIKCDSSLWSSGSNTCGKLGDGTTVTKTTPVMISSCGWKSIAPTHNHTLAIKTTGSLWAWGKNTDGELGDGSTVNKSSPVQVGAATNWVKVTSMNNLSLALREEC